MSYCNVINVTVHGVHGTIPLQLQLVAFLLVRLLLQGFMQPHSQAVYTRRNGLETLAS